MKMIKKAWASLLMLLFMIMTFSACSSTQKGHVTPPRHEASSSNRGIIAPLKKDVAKVETKTATVRQPSGKKSKNIFAKLNPRNWGKGKAKTSYDKAFKVAVTDRKIVAVESKLTPVIVVKPAKTPKVVSFGLKDRFTKNETVTEKLGELFAFEEALSADVQVLPVLPDSEGDNSEPKTGGAYTAIPTAIPTVSLDAAEETGISDPLPSPQETPVVVRYESPQVVAPEVSMSPTPMSTPVPTPADPALMPPVVLGWSDIERDVFGDHGTTLGLVQKQAEITRASAVANKQPSIGKENWYLLLAACISATVVIILSLFLSKGDNHYPSSIQEPQNVIDLGMENNPLAGFKAVKPYMTREEFETAPFVKTGGGSQVLGSIQIPKPTQVDDPLMEFIKSHRRREVRGGLDMSTSTSNTSSTSSLYESRTGTTGSDSAVVLSG